MIIEIIINYTTSRGNRTKVVKYSFNIRAKIQTHKKFQKKINNNYEV